MINAPDILAAIDKYAHTVLIPAGCALEPKAILHAICGNETNWGDDYWRWKAKHEPAFDRGGCYFNDNRFRVAKYGDLAARSWGPWQTMYPTACELGFQGHPWELMNADPACRILVAYLNKRTFVQWDKAPKATLMPPSLTIEQVGDSYNTGSLRDANHNPSYEADLAQNYAAALRWLKGPETN